MIRGTHLSDQEKGHSGVSNEQNFIGNTKEGMEKIVNPKFRQKKKITDPVHIVISLGILLILASKIG